MMTTHIAQQPSRTTALAALAAPATPAARAEALVRTYGAGENAVPALRGVSAELARGQLTAIMGPSGSGKSTFLHCLAGLDTVTSGTVVIDGVDITKLSRTALTRLRGAKLGFVFQSYNLLPMLTAEENIRLTARMAGQRVDNAWFDVLVDALGLRARLRHRPSELSGGQQQRVAVARALLTRPSVVFADEPTGNLDSQSTTEVLRFLRAAVDSYRQTVVMVTHDPYAASGSSFIRLELPWWLLSLVAGGAAVVALVTSALPARRAAAVPILEATRAE